MTAPSSAANWIARFLHSEVAGGIVLLTCTALALLVANSPVGPAYHDFWHVTLGRDIGALHLALSLEHWINDGLMAIFFFLVGLEVKREIVIGELRDPRRAVLPIVAALGGMIVPAAVYLALIGDGPGARGWGIPMATDIAFLVGCLALLGPRVPRGLRILLLTLAIADDVGAILVIAIGYSTGILVGWLLLGVLGLALVFGLTRAGIRTLAVYLLLAAAIWVAFLQSGVHATIAGVLLGLLTPIAPLATIEKGLHPWVTFVVMPVFALANAGVALDLAHLGDPVALAVGAGLLLGKPLGIVGASWIAVRLGLATLPDRVGWTAIVGGGGLAGIGFTMALFIAGLALGPELRAAAKVGILLGSTLAAIGGMGILLRVLPRGEGFTSPS
ncbi:MAG: Na+/H+ antiporter NhaA [Candidatus Binatia bacterium]